MINRNKQQGFTLIELIVVIVILGILAVTAAPKFISFTSDAKESVAEGVKGSMLASMNLVYAKAIIEGKVSTTTAGDIGGVDGIFGYPTATAAGIIAGAGISGSAVDTDSDFVYVTGTNTAGTSIITVGTSSGVTLSTAPIAADLMASGMCYVVYKEASSDAIADIPTVVVTCA
jgi:MSHA pilin protein MshA